MIQNIYLKNEPEKPIYLLTKRSNVAVHSADSFIVAYFIICM